MRLKEVSEFSIDPSEIKTRDYNMLLIISGATKAATHVDRKKERNRKNCRRKCDRYAED
jgi:hypothetical protein